MTVLYFVEFLKMLRPTVLMLTCAILSETHTLVMTVVLFLFVLYRRMSYAVFKLTWIHVMRFLDVFSEMQNERKWGPQQTAGWDALETTQKEPILVLFSV